MLPYNLITNSSWPVGNDLPYATLKSTKYEINYTNNTVCIHC